MAVHTKGGGGRALPLSPSGYVHGVDKGISIKEISMRRKELSMRRKKTNQTDQLDDNQIRKTDKTMSQ